MAVPEKQVKAMADIVINRGTDRTVEYQLQLMEHMIARKQSIIDEMAKKTGVTMLDRDSVVAPNVAHVMSFDPDQILRRAA